MDFDEFLRKYLGEIGLAQIITLALIKIGSINSAGNTLGIVFLAAVPDHWCSIPELEHLNLTMDVLKNLTIPLEEKDGDIVYSTCQKYSQNFTGWTQDQIDNVLSDGSQLTWNTTDCGSNWTYDTSIYTSTIVTEWDLVCGRSWYKATASSVYMAGLMVGVLSMGTLSDMVGRKVAIFIPMFILVVMSFGVMLSTNIMVFMVLRFLVGFACFGSGNVASILSIEIVGPSWRWHISQLGMYSWVAMYMVVGGIAYGIRDWFMLQLTFAICGLLSLVYLLLPESPRWLYARHKNDKADRIIKKTAKINKVKIPEQLDITVESERKGYFWDILRTPRIRLRSINLFFNWFVNSLVYYGLSLGSSNLGGDDFLNFFLSALVEIPAYIISHIAVRFIGRRWPLAVSQWIAGVALLCTMAVPSHLNWVIVMLTMIGKFAVTSSFSVVHVFTVELFPTVIRNTGNGACSCCARIGGIVAPFVILMNDISKYVPSTTYGSLSVVAGILILFLPETKGRKLPESLEDGENYGREKQETTLEARDTGANIRGEINPGLDVEVTAL